MNKTLYGATDPVLLAVAATSGSSANVAVKKGTYYLVASVACYCKFGLANTVTAAAFPSTQDASQRGGFYVPANLPFTWTCPVDGYLAGLAVGAGAGVLYATGPAGGSVTP